MASTLTLLRRLTTHHVELVVVGGFAAIAHGAGTVTEDIDVCLRFDEPTLTKVFEAIIDLHPRQRMHPLRPPLSPEPKDYVGYRNLYLTTDEGVLDLLGSITGVGDYDTIAARAVRMRLGDIEVPFMSLDDLITAKRAMGRPKDLRTVRELELVRDRTKR